MRKPSALAFGRRERGGDASSTPGCSSRTRRHARWSLVLFAVLFAVLAAAATTQASSAIVGYFELGGEFEGSLKEERPGEVGDVDVNANGAGTASPGDIYVLGSSVRQLSASDEFIRMWGTNTVKEGPGQANETQAVRVDATGGTFKLSFGERSTPDLSANATAAQLEAALNGLASIGAGGVSVSGGPGDAGGTTPYIVTFDGTSFAGKDQPQLKAETGSVPLSGGAASATAYTTQNGGTGFEICEPANGDGCRETGPDDAGSVAVDQANGDVYITKNNAIEKYTASGKFLYSWGYDVVASGPDDSTNNEVRSVTVKATGGTFTLGFRRAFNAPTQSTPALPYNATAEEVEAALNALEEIGGNYSSVTVTGGPGDLVGSNPYLITFHGLLGGDDLPSAPSDQDDLLSNSNALTISSGTKAAEVATVTDGGGDEICTAADACKVGYNQEQGDRPGVEAIRTYGSSLAVAPAGAPNAGDVIAGNRQSHRIQEYTNEGTFVRSFGWDVDQTNPSTGFEVCTAESGDLCKGGTQGSGVGQFGGLRGVAENSSGAIYAVEEFEDSSSPGRAQKFTPAGGLDLTPSPFGTDETQALTVNAGAGQFRLTFGAEADGTQGIGDITRGSTTVTNVVTTKGEFAVGQALNNGAGEMFETEIVGVGPNTLTISHPIETISFPVGASMRLEVPLRSDRPYKTTSLPFNASASEVETALDSLPSVNSGGGSVSVMGGPGDPAGSSPYTITFDGGPMARTDPALILGSSGATPLSGGSGADADTVSVSTITPGGPTGTERNTQPYDIGVNAGGHVFVAKFFPRAYTQCANGAISPWETRIEELDSSGTVLGTSDACNGVSGFFSSDNRRTSLAVNTLTGHSYLLNQNSPIRAPLVNIYGPSGAGPNLSLDPILGIGDDSGTISGTINPNGPGTSYPDTTGTPRAAKTTYRVEFKRSSDAKWTRYTDDTPLSSSTSPVPFSVGVSGLDPNTEYELKVVAVKPFTTSVEDTKSFTTLPAAPLIEALSSSDLTASSGTLHALINPQGSPTSYHFEYGTTLAYGNSTPEASIGASHAGEAVQDQIEGLQDAVYHFRVVATNSSGTTTSEDHAFSFHPPICPNQTVRQQTGAAYLPDCRAYELVSPEDAGGTTFFTGGPQSPYASNPPRLAFVGRLAAIPGAGRNPINTAGDLYLATRGAEGWHTRYIGPSSEEAGCVGGRPLVNGSGPPTTIQNDVMADPGLDHIIDWNLGNPPECASGWEGSTRFPNDHNTAAVGSNAPYVWNSQGDFLDRWPTSVADAPGTEANFACPQDPSIHPFPDGFFENIPVSYFCSTYVDASKDLNHFVFSTQSGLFDEGGLSAAPGSAYDNDTAHNTLRLISKQANGDPIEQEPGKTAGPEELIRFAKVSADGSHILMATATKPECKQFDFPGGAEDAPAMCPLVTQPSHLYMRVNDAITYDVSGVPVHYVGANADATKVYFTSAQQLTADDIDTSTDLYMWSENDGHPTLIRISKGGVEEGNGDDCVATWTMKCNVKVYEDTEITTVEGNQGGLGGFSREETNPGYTDNAIAARSGDIYFYSPDQLVAGKGTPGRENLYVYREGDVHHVATLEDNPYCISGILFTRKTCSNGAMGRLQVTSDGRFAAFVTTSRLTAYDNHGFAEMYRYDADAEKVQCISCRSDGSAPESDVLGSEGGRFLTDDGRVFFDTPEPLDPRDTNTARGQFEEALGYDVYEFVDGGPRLISTGTGTLRNLGRSVAGFYGVSANGVDVYFGTFETLVGQDHNGQQLKFYDARTNGGFSFVPPSAPCAAADECHGPTAVPPAPLAGGTTPQLGAGGNVNPARHRKPRRKRRHDRGKRSNRQPVSNKKAARRPQLGGAR